MTSEATQAAASLEDAQESIDALSDADLIRLNKIAGAYNHATGIDADDLMQQALVSIYAGERRWIGGADFVSFVAGALKSIAYNQRTSAYQRHVSRDSDDSVLADFPSHSPTPEKALVLQDVIGQIDRLFSDDPAAELVIDAIALGDTPKDIQEALELTPTEYATIRKRIRRRINAFSTNGEDI